MIKRPSPGETEEDLLRMQNEFLAAKGQSAARVIKKLGEKRGQDGLEVETSCTNKSRDVVQIDTLPSILSCIEAAPRKKSRFRAKQEEKKELHSAQADNDVDMEQEMDKKDTGVAAVLSKIIERDTRNMIYKTPCQMLQPFPVVPVNQYVSCEQGDQNKTTGKKKSIFAQQFSKMVAKDFGMVLEEEIKKKKEKEAESSVMEEDADAAQSTNLAASSGSSTVVEGTGLSATFGKEEAHRIHQENLQTLSVTSQDEILAEQKKLLETLDHRIVEFLNSRKKRKQSTQNQKSEPAITYSDSSAKKNKDIAAKTKEETKVPVEVDKKWLHMGKVEYDKLEWMKNLPPPSASGQKTGQQARFDFQGNLILADADIPVHLGLHHHGEEPERAGYTLEELFLLSRSSNVQQRTLALQILGRVIQKAKDGSLDQLIQTPILPSILDAGVVFLLRWALDDSVDAVVVSAIAALNSLLVSQADEMALNHVFGWYQGHCVAALCPPQPEEKNTATSRLRISKLDEDVQETDADMSKRDLIKALVERMFLMNRLRYILEKTQPQGPTVLNILAILTRIGRHSTEIAHQLLHSSGLVELIVKEFLPLSWVVEDITKPLSSVYGVPIPSALKFIRTVAQAGRNMAFFLLSKHHMKIRILRYLADEEALCTQLPDSEACALQTEALRMLRVCFLYGLAEDLFVDLYPSLVVQLIAVQNLYQQENLSTAHMQRISALIGAFEAAVCTAGNTSAARFERHEDGSSRGVKKSEKTLGWSKVMSLIQPIGLLLRTLLKDIGSSYQFKKYDLQVATACLNFAATFYWRWSNQWEYEPLKCLPQLEDFNNNILQPCWAAFGFQVITQNLSKYSNMLNQQESPRQEVSSCLPEYGNSLAFEEQSLPVTRCHSPYGFLTAVLHLAFEMCRIHKGLQEKLLQMVCTDSNINSYMKKISKCARSHLHSNFFTKFENHFQYFFLKLTTLYKCAMMRTSVEPHLHHVALKLLTSLHHGDEHLVHDLMSCVIFDPMFWSVTEEEKARIVLADLQLTSPIQLRSATQEEIQFTQTQLCQEARENLHSIRATYLKAFGCSEADMYKSRDRFHMNTTKITSFFTSNLGESLLPQDWIYLPLIELYNTYCTIGAEGQSILSASQIAVVYDVLKWIFLMECERSKVMDGISVTLKVSRVMCTFLTGNDLFLERSIHRYLVALLHHYTKPSLLDQMDFEEPIPGIVSFYDLYMGLLQQYEAVSFGDSVFGCYVLVPLQQQHNLMLRKAVWTEHTGILRTLTLPIQELLIPLERYLTPEESDMDLLKQYFQGLYSQALRPKWAPVLYLIAVHHVNRFLYNQDGQHTQLKHHFIKQLLVTANEEVKHHVLYYKQANSQNPLGMEFFTELPPIRKTLVDTLSAN
ncbi:hypothetical protein CHS0354_021622 [Potamilus streckersoni]|uniref:RNA polymerase II-associated protein 1 n=1 Tax=Potamilus streckersoni TaxID=2493646 RepID=A0AAE0SNZ8_9BIVA|nr:hypothetical protein CHS0354_021622 [Potamilus streckersoni]